MIRLAASITDTIAVTGWRLSGRHCYPHGAISRRISGVSADLQQRLSTLEYLAPKPRPDHSSRRVALA